MKEKINIVPDVSLFAKLGSANYTVSEAVSELIDNSIDAREEKVSIRIRISKNEVIIEDDGKGMDKQTSINSIVLGKSSKKAGELGHFGMGLKTSCMSLGRKFSLHTSIKGTVEKYSIDFDAEEWEKTGTWDQEIHISTDSGRNDSGTRIHITKLRFNQHKNLVDSLLEHLSERFGVFVKNKEAEISVNGRDVISSEPGLVDGTKVDFIIELGNGEKIKGWTGILEKGSQEKSGFNLYRYNRLIRAHEKLGYQYHPSKMWVTGEINLDPIPVTHNKREFISTDPLFAEFFEKFKDILKDVIDKSQNKNKEEQVKDLPRHIKETLRDNLLEALNNFDELKEFAFPGEKQLKRGDDGEESGKEKRNAAGNLPEDDSDKDALNDQNRTPKKVSPEKAKFIAINGQKYRFEFEWANLDDEEKSKEAYLDPATNTIMVLLNSKYKLLDFIKPDILYMIFYISEGIVEVFLKEGGQSNDRLVHLRDGIIKRLADIYADDIEIKIKEKDENEVEAYNHLVSNKTQEDKILSENEKKCLSMRLEQGMTLQQIGNDLGFTRERARQILNKALAKINNQDSSVSQKEDTVPINKENADNAEEVILGASQAYGVSMEDIKGKSRLKNLVLARHIAMYNLRSMLGMSFPAIARIFDRDHTTIMHACNKIGELMYQEE